MRYELLLAFIAFCVMMLIAMPWLLPVVIVIVIWIILDK